MSAERDANADSLVTQLARVFWPEFVLHGGFLLRSGFDQRSLEGFLKQCDGDRQSVEAVMNHAHVDDMILGLFGAGEDHSIHLVDRLGRMLQDMWTTKLRRDFPDLSIAVTFDGDAITAFQAAETE